MSARKLRAYSEAVNSAKRAQPGKIVKARAGIAMQHMNSSCRSTGRAPSKLPQRQVLTTHVASLRCGNDTVGIKQGTGISKAPSSASDYKAQAIRVRARKVVGAFDQRHRFF